jgi:hypothetical protein
MVKKSGIDLSLSALGGGQGSSPQINIRIIPNVQCSCLSTDGCITADQRIIEYDVIEVREGADDGALNNGVVYFGIIADRYVRTDDGVLNSAVLSNAHGLDQDRVLKLRALLGTGVKLLQESSVRF